MNAELHEPGEPAAYKRAGRMGLEGQLLQLAGPLFHRILDRIDAGLAEGQLEVTLPNGEQRLLGGLAPGPDVAVDIASWRALLRLATGGSIGWYQAWTRGEWSADNTIALFELFVRNRRTLGNAARAGGLRRLIERVRHDRRDNNRRGARSNIASHYDLGNDFYAAWLDLALNYSSAMFTHPVSEAETLEAAQQRKLAAMLDRTATAPGDRILEIGCGWGGFARVAAAAGRRVHGITLSTAQQEAISCANLPGVEITLTDYRDISDSYDAVVSIEMAEAVGLRYWGAYLGAIAKALKPGGRAAIQFIAIDDAIFDRYARNVDFIQRYIFPGGMLLSERLFRAEAEQLGLAWTDRQSLALDYVETLRRWRHNFDAAIAEGRLPRRFDRDFQAMWRYYLMYCEGGFRGGGIDVAQVTLIREG